MAGLSKTRIGVALDQLRADLGADGPVVARRLDPHCGQHEPGQQQ